MQVPKERQHCFVSRLCLHVWCFRWKICISYKGNVVREENKLPKSANWSLQVFSEMGGAGRQWYLAPGITSFTGCCWQSCPKYWLKYSERDVMRMLSQGLAEYHCSQYPCAVQAARCSPLYSHRLHSSWRATLGLLWFYETVRRGHKYDLQTY